MNHKLLILALCTLVQGCSKIDDYMLGKDNTPKPKALEQITAKINTTTKWSMPAGTSSKGHGYLKLKPVANKGAIYIADQSGLVQSIAQSSGKILWSQPLKTGLVSGPAIGDGVIAVGTNRSSLVLLSQNDGSKLWTAKLSGELLAPPAIAQHRLIAKTIDGKVYAFDLKTGKQLWMVEHGAPNLILKASSSPVVMDNLVLIGFPDGKLDALELQTGRLLWQRSIAYATGASDVERLVDIDADPIIQGDVVYLASYQGYVGALSLDNGEFIWRKSASIYKDMTLHSNTLYYTDSNDVVWSLNASTGMVNWKQKTLKARDVTEPVLWGNYLIVGDKTGYLHFIEPQTGEFIGRTSLSSGVSIAPIVIGKKLYVLTNNGLLNQLMVS
ncbi:MAG: outer membrane protein assembly factor BamB [Legionella sp.]|nr:MAG: outer membrane protein assembly factor BamB [Legionella sp.]PJD98970.1 MAG: outer membrane protein assembly factor BamB [Legionella sp.]